MDAIKFCRFCLITDTKMETVREKEIECFIDPSEVYSPILACYECLAIIGKINKFVNKFSTVRAVLENILETEGCINEETLKSYDRKLLQLQSTLECCENPVIISCFTIPEAYLPTQEHSSPEVKDGTSKSTEIVKAKGVFDNDGADNNTLNRFENDSSHKMEPVEVKVKAKQRKIDDDSNDSNSIYMDNILKNDQNDINDVQLNRDLSEVHVDINDHSIDFGKVLKDIEYISGDNDLNQIMRKKRKTSVPKSPMKNRTRKNKLHLLEYLFEITELTRSEQIKEFSKRRESIYYLNNIYKCELCFRGFNHRTTYDTHVKLFHDPDIGPSKCPVCNIIKKNNVKLNKHMYNFHKHLYKCKKCDFISTMRSAVDKHRKWHDGAVYSCKVCGESFDNMMSQLGHERSKHPSEFLCDLCGLPFLSMHGIRAHKRMAHFNHKESTIEADPQLYCEDCKIQFATSDAWHTHLQKSIKHNPHKQTTVTPTPRPWVPMCRFCGQQCKDREELRAHQSTKHRNRPKAPRTHSGPKTLRPATRQVQQYPTQCHYCDQMLTSKGQHWHHHRSLHFDKRYKQGNFVCDMCGKTLMSKGALNMHMQATHSELGKRFECDYCHMKFASKVYLKRHIQRHLYFTHLCTKCEKVFKSKDSLRIHIRNAHGGPRPHQCRFCQKTFVLGSLLKVHVNEVHLRLAKKRIRTTKKAKS